MPGMPVPARCTAGAQQACHRGIVKAGLATNCEIQRHSMFYRKHYFIPIWQNFQTTQGPVAFAMYGHLDLDDVTGRGAAERPDCAFGEAEAQSLASASANAEGLSTSMTSTMREGNQRAGHLASYDASNLQMPERREDGSYIGAHSFCASTWMRTLPRWSTGRPRAALPPLPSRSSTTNRCGTPLIDSSPSPTSAHARGGSRLFMEKLRRIL